MDITARRVRVLGISACFLALAAAILIRVGLNDGGWPLFLPALAAAGVVVWPTRLMLGAAIAITASIVVLGLMSIGYFYGVSLALLIFALAELRRPSEKATA